MFANLFIMGINFTLILRYFRIKGSLFHFITNMIKNHASKGLFMLKILVQLACVYISVVLLLLCPSNFCIIRKSIISHNRKLRFRFRQHHVQAWSYRPPERLIVSVSCIFVPQNIFLEAIHILKYPRDLLLQLSMSENLLSML